ncbi:conserved hypothetical protein [Frankia canadensis]|uniref:RloB-like protein n=1 Tax=Frankia canadensis TaxID=1836972 RepID=A0A2I2KUM8_9ACTN|nr:conserved hypothetical protein [Frankia canadensis]SOU56654.1 conserved hypothetical protein [Frankia canadensis]
MAANAAIRIEIVVAPGVPATLVRRAVEKARDPEIDECWCTFDVEWPTNHPNLKQAVSLARENGIRLAISNPCFELWLVLHFEDHRRFSDNATIERRSRELDGRSGKGIDPAVYMPRRWEAVERARALEAMHLRNSVRFPADNPSSSMADLVIATGGQAAAPDYSESRGDGPGRRGVRSNR